MKVTEIRWKWRVFRKYFWNGKIMQKEVFKSPNIKSSAFSSRLRQLNLNICGVNVYTYMSEFWAELQLYPGNEVTIPVSLKGQKILLFYMFIFRARGTLPYQCLSFYVQGEKSDRINLWFGRGISTLNFCETTYTSQFLLDKASVQTQRPGNHVSPCYPW